MPDNLRTRIAAVARSFLLDHFIVDHEQAQGLWPEYLADTLIRELGWQHVIDYCERQAALGWRDVGTADEALGRNIVAETVLTMLEGNTNA